MTTLSLSLPDSLAERLRIEAAMHGLSLETYTVARLDTLFSIETYTNGANGTHPAEPQSLADEWLAILEPVWRTREQPAGISYLSELSGYPTDTEIAAYTERRAAGDSAQTARKTVFGR